MANEIRVLEDQLYDADYQNQVLREKLHRAQSKLVEPQSIPYGRPLSERTPPQPTPAEPTPVEVTPAEPSKSETDSLDEDFEMGIDLGEPMIDNGAFADPENVPVPEPESDTTDDQDTLPAPGGPEPPGPQDLELPPIDPGEILPPPAPGEDRAVPPGKIDVPKSLGRLPEAMPIPQGLRLHSGLSGGHRFDGDDEVDGLYLVVNVVDDQGHMMDLNDLEIEATMTIVALDPILDPEVARIARWEYSADELRQFIRSAPVAGLHVPVRWQQSRPSGEEVVVHVRLQTADEEMRCDGRLKIAQPETIADWTPRGRNKTR